MYKVISLKPKGKKFNVVIQDESDKEKTFILSDDIVVEYRLVKNKEMTKEQYKEFANAANRDKIYQKVLYFATYKQRSIKEVRDYLTKKEILDKDQLYYINKLKKVSILNDDSYAKNYVFEAFNYKSLGPRRIIQDLKLKGIRKEIYENYISDISHEYIIKNIETLFFKKLKDYKNKSYNKTIQSLKRFLIQKGYEFTDIDYIINMNSVKIKADINEPEALKKDFALAEKQFERKKPKQDKRQYIIKKLLAKGYNYNDIKHYFEGS